MARTTSIPRRPPLRARTVLGPPMNQVAPLVVPLALTVPFVPLAPLAPTVALVPLIPLVPLAPLAVYVVYVNCSTHSFHLRCEWRVEPGAGVAQVARVPQNFNSSPRSLVQSCCSGGANESMFQIVPLAPLGLCLTCSTRSCCLAVAGVACLGEWR